MAVAFPLSAGKIIEPGSVRRPFRALVSSYVRFELGGSAEMRHLAVSNRIWSAMTRGRVRIKDSTSAKIPSLGILMGDKLVLWQALVLCFRIEV
ncbi:hypothetical protein Trydic_g12839 [Trypoxylus dichotomus]